MSSELAKIEVENLNPNTTYSVFLDNGSTPVATLTTNAEGEAELTLFNPSFQIKDGTQLTVKDAGGTVVLQGTFHVGTGDDSGDDSGDDHGGSHDD